MVVFQFQPCALSVREETEQFRVKVADVIHIQTQHTSLDLCMKRYDDGCKNVVVVVVQATGE